MSDIRSWSYPFAAIGGGFSSPGYPGTGGVGQGGTDTFLTLAGTTITTWPIPSTTVLTGRLYSISCTNRDPAPRYLQIWAGAQPGLSSLYPNAFKSTPIMQFSMAGASYAGSTLVTPTVLTLARDFFGVSGLEFVGPNQPAGSRGLLPISMFNSVPPNACGFCVAISTTPYVYTAANPLEHDLQGMMGA
jgi:hypothetical protein